ncbi:MAG: glycosyltransferase family 2 protein [Planctomycetota bacterium]|jgi:glycosyltransferase involved in cell wall biosynthesis
MKEPKISIITPSFNHSRYIEICIESIKSQEYPNVEHIIMDGGSKDGTVEILKKHSGITWISEPDRGQSDAVNRGMKMASGEIANWVCADDLLYPGALRKIADTYNEDSEPDVLCFGGRAEFPGTDRVQEIMPLQDVTLESLVEYWRAPENRWNLQPATFYKRDLFLKAGGLKLHQHLAMDYDLWLRFAAAGARFVSRDEIIARVLMQPAAKSMVSGKAQDIEKHLISRRYWGGAFDSAVKTASLCLWQSRDASRKLLHESGACSRKGNFSCALKGILYALMMRPGSLFSRHFWHALRLALRL